MKISDFIRATKDVEAMKMRCGITPCLYRNFAIYEQYEQMSREYEKKTYIYMVLSEKYGLHPRNVRRMIKTYQSEL